MDVAVVSAGFVARPASRARALEAVYAAGHWLLESDRVADAARVFRTLLRAAPRDVRAWLALGLCHERIDQPGVALELYATGGVVAESPARCHLARARLLTKLLRVDEAAEAIDRAEHTAGEDDELAELVACERRSAR